ncbi:chloride channel protein [Legionella maioricensis]|uniref:Chloride channel protein n=1 Tax=Legionella maioricensis TaxID=2896528 RepID=A0A9X2CYW8_9GAMM|nr:chloride channel protein [Legionella maioricensis]MCL9683455.1 chloride channel protein [Legionella maioricensis]MCL9688626.1 chloride channel protein [Legionella maioricensis]
MSSIRKKAQPTTSYLTLFIATIIVGIGSGFFAMLLALLLHFLQHVAYGYSLGQIISSESFLEGVSASSPLRRVIVLMLCGLIAGVGWWALYRFGKPLVSIAEAVKTKKMMPPSATIIHALLQIITIALGSPLGREVAPREVGAIFSFWFASKLKLSVDEATILLACGAGAGLAAVYNVPLGGALFIMEVLLCTFNWSVLIPALTTCAIAVVISWIGLGNEPLYHIPDLHISYPLVVWSILAGPIFGYAAYWFILIANKARTHSHHNWHMPIICFINFTLIGVLAMYFPSLLGNGKSPAEMEFDDLDNVVGIELSLTLLVLRVLICWSSLGSGAQGGLLTPSLANGALLAVVLGGLWNLLWPETSLSAFAIIGAAAFLAAAQKMPITAIVLIFELTRIKFNFLIPILFAVSGAVGMSKLCMNGFLQVQKAKT